MLGNDRFSFETPNVIDPGDLPPSRPSRGLFSKSTEKRRPGGERSKGRNIKFNRKSGGTGAFETEEDYNQARESAARLLRDISDLDLNPAAPAPYDPYDDDDEVIDKMNTNGNGNHHSLPIPIISKEISHMHATSLLKSETQPLSLSRTVKVRENESSKHLVRNRILGSIRPNVICIVLVIMLVAAVFIVTIAVNRSDGITLGNGTYTMESSERYQRLVRLLSEITVSDVEALTTRGTPQYNAAYWIANEDNEQREISDNVKLGYDPERLLQRYILAVFFFATGGPTHWNNRFDFLTATDECAWSSEMEMTQYISQQYSVGVGCDTDLQVRSLFLPDNNLTGTIPYEVQFLNTLFLLSVRNNHLFGTIPTALEDLHDLVYLNLNYNNFTGEIPEFLGDYEKLEVLGLSSNHLTGSVPDSIGTLGVLKTLALDDNNLTGSIDFIQYMDNLEFVYLEKNNFYGTMDASIFSDLEMLREIDVSDNKLYGNFDLSTLFQFDVLHTIDLSNNDLSGQIPDVATYNDVLHYLSLRDNKFDGVIPTSIYYLERLTHLDLHGNNFNGEIPNSLGKLEELSYLALGNNDFTGDIPPISLPPLRELSLSGLGLTEFPMWVTYLSTLQLLDLSFNEISTTIPSKVWNMTSLQYFILNDNKLIGNIPQTGSGAQNLKVLTLHHNLLEGDADYVCQKAADLRTFSRDCTVNCDSDCCTSCCADGAGNCFDNDTITMIDETEVKYKRNSFSFDPDILDAANLFRIVSEGDAEVDFYIDP